MCVICVKPKRKVIPQAYLKRMFNHEPHGAGFGVSLGNKVYFEKGFMTFEEFINAFERWNTEKHLVVVHFRTASVGSITANLTHPFPLTNDENHLLGLQGFSQSILFHNGTIPKIASGDLSDTASLAKLLGYYREKYKMSIADIVKFIETIDSYSKFILQTRNKVYLIGDFQEKDGLYFSHLHWENDYWGYRYRYGTRYKRDWWWNNQDMKTDSNKDSKKKGNKEKDYWLWSDYDVS